MAITWGRLRRRIDRNEQATRTEPDEHDVRASEDVRERQERRLTLDAEIAREHRVKPPLGWGGPIG